MTGQHFNIAAAIDQHHEKVVQGPRPHLGASMLGHPCDRYLWLSFRWSVQEKFPGRMLRLFRRGQNEESTVVADLKAIGADVIKTGQDQSRVDFGSHVSGSIDGVIQSGLPNQNEPMVLEIKTHSLKSFTQLEDDGVRKAKPMHWTQMQVYMLGLGLKKALYFAVCKNDDAIYTEIVDLDRDAAIAAIERGKRIALSDRMPEPMPGASASWHTCKYCPAYAMCWEKQPTQHVNCRTCAHSTACEDSAFKCEKYQAVIPIHAQHEGCDRHVLHPDMVPWQLSEADSTEDVAAYVIDGRVVKNGMPGPGVYSSHEILANPSGCKGFDAVEELRAKFCAKVVG